MSLDRISYLPEHLLAMDVRPEQTDGVPIGAISAMVDIVADEAWTFTDSNSGEPVSVGGALYKGRSADIFQYNDRNLVKRHAKSLLRAGLNWMNELKQKGFIRLMTSNTEERSNKWCEAMGMEKIGTRYDNDEPVDIYERVL